MSLHFIIDGYNVIHHPLYHTKAGASTDCRQGLLEFILRHRLTGSRANQLTIVFDGYPAGPASLAEHPDNVQVIFSRQKTADERIDQLLERAQGLRSIVVVSDDRQVQWAARAAGAQTKSVEEFCVPRTRADAAATHEHSPTKVTYTQMQAINRELRQRWLNE